MTHFHNFYTPEALAKDETLKKEERKMFLPGGMSGIFIVFTDSILIFWAIYLIADGFTAWQIGMLFASLKIASLLVTIPGGILSDRLKAKTIIGLGIILSIFHLFGSIYAINFRTLLILFLIGGIGQTFHNTSIDSIVYKNLEKKIRDKEIGMFLSIRFVILGLGSILLGLILNSIPFTSLLKVTTVILLILFALSFKLPNTKSEKINLKQYEKDIFKPKVLIFLITIFLYALHTGMEAVTIGPYLKTVLNLTPFEIGLYLGISLMTMGFTIVKTGSKLQSKKIIASNALTYGIYLSAIGIILIAHPSPAISFIGRLIHVNGDAIVYVALYHDISTLFPAKHAGGDSSLISLTFITATFTGSLIFGSLASKFDYNLSILLSGTIGFLSLIFYMLQKQHHTKSVKQT